MSTFLAITAFYSSFFGESQAVFSRLTTLVKQHYRISELIDSPRLIGELCPNNYVSHQMQVQNVFLYLCKSPRSQPTPRDSYVAFDGLIGFVDSPLVDGRPLGPRQVVVKFPLTSVAPLFSEYTTAVKAADATPSTLPPIFARYLYPVTSLDFHELLRLGVRFHHAGPPGAIFEFVDGQPLSQALVASRIRDLEAAAKVSAKTPEAGATAAATASTQWLGCVTIQRMLIYLHGFSQGLYFHDLTSRNFVVDRKRRFWLNADVVCEAVRVVDAPGFRDVADSGIWALAGNLAEALKSIDDVYVWTKGTSVEVHEEVIKLTAQIMEIDPVLEYEILSMIQNRIGKMRRRGDSHAWIVDLHEKLVHRLYGGHPCLGI
jgi:hypothetical protein